MIKFTDSEVSCNWFQHENIVQSIDLFVGMNKKERERKFVSVLVRFALCYSYCDSKFKIEWLTVTECISKQIHRIPSRSTGNSFYSNYLSSRVKVKIHHKKFTHSVNDIHNLKWDPCASFIPSVSMMWNKTKRNNNKKTNTTCWESDLFAAHSPQAIIFVLLLRNSTKILICDSRCNHKQLNTIILITYFRLISIYSFIQSFVCSFIQSFSIFKTNHNHVRMLIPDFNKREKYTHTNRLWKSDVNSVIFDVDFI